MTERQTPVSEREAEVLGLLADRLSNARIAARLHISVRTVESHVSSLLRKYDVADRAALTAIIGAVPGGVPRLGALSGLPAFRTGLVGRAGEGDALREVLRQGGLVTLVGPGGVGKTRLAAAVAEDVASDFPFGIAFVDLVPVREGVVAEAVAAVLGVAESPRQPLAEAVAHRLGVGRSLLVLDNCEHLLEPVAEFAGRVLAACPGLTILATSRERLAVPGERVITVAPLPLGSDAERLFLERVAAIDPEFTASPADVTEICARLDGLPLAIELAAARAASLGTGGLLAGLDDRLRLVSGGRGTHERHRSLRAVMAWSHGLLDAEERALLRRLSVFAGAFDLDAVLAVAAPTPDGDRGAESDRAPDGDRVAGGDRGVAADLLGRLTEKSMLVHQSGAVSRWRMLETIRAFCEEQLRIHDEGPGLRTRHLDWAADTAAALVRGLGDDPQDASGAFDAVAADLRRAVHDHLPDGPDPAAHGLARALARLTYARRFLQEAAERYREAAALAPTPREAARDLRAAADVTLVGTDSGTEAFDMLLAAAEQAAEAGDGDAAAMALARAVETASRFHGDPAAVISRSRLRDLLAAAQAHGAPAAPPDRTANPTGHDVSPAGGGVSPAGRGVSPAGRGVSPAVRAGLAVAAAWTAGRTWRDPDPDLAAEAAEAARMAGDPVLISAALDAVSTAAIRAGHLRRAHRVSGERLALVSTMARDDPYMGPEVADSLQMAATYAIAAGDLPAALSAARWLQTDELVGGHPFASLDKLVTVLVLRGEFDEALEHAGRMWDGWVQAGRPAAPALATSALAVALARGLSGDEADFHRWSERALATAGVTGLDQAPGIAPFAIFAEARLAAETRGTVEAPRPVDAAALVERAFGHFPLSRHETYARAAGAELAVVAGLPDAPARLTAAGPAAAENEWAAACLVRAEGRLHRDPGLLADAARRWEGLGARFELARTQELITAPTKPS